MASIGSEEARAIADLDNINAVDPDAHEHADTIVLALLAPEVRAAYERTVERCSWWKAVW